MTPTVSISTESFKSYRAYERELKTRRQTDRQKLKKHVNRDSHIASLPISQSSFFKSMLLDYDFLIEEASWINRNLEVSYYDEKN